MAESVAMKAAPPAPKISVFHPFQTRRVYRDNVTTLTRDIGPFNRALADAHDLVQKIKQEKGKPDDFSTRASIAIVKPAEVVEMTPQMTQLSSNLLAEANRLSKKHARTVEQTETARNTLTKIHNILGNVGIGGMIIGLSAIFTSVASMPPTVASAISGSELGLFFSGAGIFAASALLTHRLVKQDLTKYWSMGWYRITELANKTIEQVPGIVSKLTQRQ